MSSGYIDKTIRVTLSPDELRNLADKMEADFPKKLPGDSTFIDFLVYSRDLRIALHADQEWFHKNALKRRAVG